MGCLALVTLLAAGCASKMLPLEGQSAEQMEKDRAECLAEAQSTSSVSLQSGWFSPQNWFYNLLTSPIQYVVKHEQAVGDLTDACMLGRGYQRTDR